MGKSVVEVSYTNRFVRAFGALPRGLQEDVLVCIERFKDVQNHQELRVHHLKGLLKGRMSFSINYSYRIVFEFGKNKSSAIFHAIGTHAIYK
jgi:mRNA-degrading endonuclease YafQ of YafQ-DinJ toxin-antitoxin module